MLIGDPSAMVARLDLHLPAMRRVSRRASGPARSRWCCRGGERRVPARLRGPEGGVAVRWTPHPGIAAPARGVRRADHVAPARTGPGYRRRWPRREIVAQWSDAVHRGVLRVLDGGRLSAIAVHHGRRLHGAAPPRASARARSPAASLRESVPDLDRRHLNRMRLLFVCTGNTCRSPMAEGIARRLIDRARATDLEVSSAGTSGVARMRPRPTARCSSPWSTGSTSPTIVRGSSRARSCRAVRPHPRDGPASPRTRRSAGRGRTRPICSRGYRRAAQRDRPISDPFGGDLERVPRDLRRAASGRSRRALDRIAAERARRGRLP